MVVCNWEFPFVGSQTCKFNSVLRPVHELLWVLGPKPDAERLKRKLDFSLRMEPLVQVPRAVPGSQQHRFRWKEKLVIVVVGMAVGRR
jgi:hypothetical protein